MPTIKQCMTGRPHEEKIAYLSSRMEGLLMEMGSSAVKEKKNRKPFQLKYLILIKEAAILRYPANELDNFRERYSNLVSLLS